VIGIANGHGDGTALTADCIALVRSAAAPASTRNGAAVDVRR
jgi:hypothetical protein